MSSAVLRKHRFVSVCECEWDSDLSWNHRRVLRSDWSGFSLFKGFVLGNKGQALDYSSNTDVQL